MGIGLGSTLSLSHRLRAEPLEVSLRRKHFRPCVGRFSDHVHILVLGSGSVDLQGEDYLHRLQGPAGLILPAAPEWLIGLEAGSEGWLFGLPPDLVAEIAGPGPELASLFPHGRQGLLAPILPQQAPVDCRSFCEAIMAELAVDRVARETAVLSYLRLLCLQLWRESHHRSEVASLGQEETLLENFRREVEVHLRDHLPVADYAQRLGVSPTRLRRACQRRLGRSPLELIHERMMREARAWLEHSGKSVAEIAQALGFSDSAEFSHFFKRKSGHAPTHFRDQSRNAPSSTSVERNSFTDWP